MKKIQYNIKIEESVKDKLKHIAVITSEKLKLDINASQITRQAILEFIDRWDKENDDR